MFNCIVLEFYDMVSISFHYVRMLVICVGFKRCTYRIRFRYSDVKFIALVLGREIFHRCNRNCAFHIHISERNGEAYFNRKLYNNKHTESIAKAIQVPHRPQHIQICNRYLSALFKNAITRQNVDQIWQKSNLTCNCTYGSLLSTFIQICESKCKKVRKMNCERRPITHEKVDQSWRKSNLICNISCESLLPTFI